VVSLAQPEKTSPLAAKKLSTKCRVLITVNTCSRADLVATSGAGIADSVDAGVADGQSIGLSPSLIISAAAFADRQKLADYVNYMKTNLIALTLLALAAVVLAGCTTTTETTTTRTREQSSMYAR
jgi:hypothetical protein